MRILPRLLRRVIHTGSLTLIGPDGASETFGGKTPGPSVTIRITDPALDAKLLLNPELRFAEAYMDGGLEVAPEDLRALLRLFKLNKKRLNRAPAQSMVRRTARVLKRIIRNNPFRARRNAAAHYDIGNDLYRLFLDPDMQYSCAYFPEGGETLEQAQLAKKRHIAAKLLLKQLAPDGVALIHSIMRGSASGVTSPFTAKYIFPGGYIPALSETVAAVEQSRLWLLDCEIWRRHYATTIEHWARRFAANRDQARALHDERFCRMWELYLAGAESSFRTGRMAVMQLQLGHQRDAAPLGRDYMAAETARLRAREATMPGIELGNVRPGLEA